MSLVESQMEKEQRERQLKRIAGKPQHIEINERTLEAYRKAYADKGLVITKEEEYPQEDFHTVAKQKKFDALVDPEQGIRKIIEGMVRQPITIFDKNGKPEVKDALYYRGYWYGNDKKGNDIGAPFIEGSYKKPKMSFVHTDSVNPFDPKTGERRGQYRASGFQYQHYIFISSDKKERRKQLEDILQKATGTHTGNLGIGGHLSYRHPLPNNDHSGTHGGSFNWDTFCDLSIEQLGQVQQKRYWKDDKGILRDKDNIKVEYDPSTGKLEKTDHR